MKKLLLGSTALVVGGLVAAPAMAADPIKIGVGGYYTFYAIAGGIDSTYATNGTWTQYKGLNLIQEGEIHFIGQTKLDNGTSVGVHVELEAWNAATATPNAAGVVNGSNSQWIDEAFLFAFGDWGRIELGSRDPATYRMYYGMPSALIGFGAIQHNTNFSWANASVIANNKAFFKVTAQTNAAQVQDGNRINYFTPRFQGLQIGIGYAPKWTPAGTGPASLGAGFCGYNNATTVNNCPTADYSYQDLIDVGANYLNKFGDVTVALYGAFFYASFVPGNQPFAAAANLTTGANLTSWKNWVVGAQLGFKGFTLGGSIGQDNNGLGSNYYTGQNNDTRYYSAGLMYETGPWQLSAGWMGARNNNGNGSQTVGAIAPGTNLQTLNTPASTSAAFSQNQTGALRFGQESVDKFEIGINYALGPGVKLTGGGLYYNATGPSNAVAGNSWGLLLGMDLRF